jgi:hypothetical protein
MFPTHVSDANIRAVIRELTRGSELPSGALLRAVLHQRYGSRGGVTRIYRLLAQARTQLIPPPKPEPSALLQAELQRLRERAQRAEQREEAHQSRWAVEVDSLRVKVAALEPLAQQAHTALETLTLVRRELQAAYIRIATLEQQLLSEQAGEGKDVGQ